MRFRLGEKRVTFVHVSYLPILSEIKTKPTQHGVQDLRKVGISPNFLCVRCEVWPDRPVLEKLCLSCQVPMENIIVNNDVSNIYKVPLVFHSQRLSRLLLERMEIEVPKTNSMKEWETISKLFENQYPRVSVAIIGKYTKLPDAYLSLLHAINHASAHLGMTPDIRWIESTSLDNEGMVGEGWEELSKCDCAIIPGGFGIRGISGMIDAATFLRERKVPTLGICLGMQIMVIEAARNMASIKNAGSSESDTASNNNQMGSGGNKDEGSTHVISIIPTQSGDMGGTMRLGAMDTILAEGSLARDIYCSDTVQERHRHRYEVNPKYIESLVNSGIQFTGISRRGVSMDNTYSDQQNIVDAFEINRKEQFYFGCQYHPEYKTSPSKPHPLFTALLSRTKANNNAGWATS